MSKGKIRIVRDGNKEDIELTSPPPRRRGDRLIVNTPDGERVLDERKEVVGWTYEDSTH